jgi:hypothetical protein
MFAYNLTLTTYNISDWNIIILKDEFQDKRKI